MADRDDEDLQMAIRMSLQSAEEEARNRRLQWELMALAAEKRIGASENTSVSPVQPVVTTVSKSIAARGPTVREADVACSIPGEKMERGEHCVSDSGEELSVADADQLFSMVFGSEVSNNILSQWSNQGIRFSSDPETCMGLVQHEGGPCGVLAAIQAFVLKYLLFFQDDLSKFEVNDPLQSFCLRRFWQSSYAATNAFTSLTEDRKARALVLSMVEILFLCGNKSRVVIATLSGFSHQSEEVSEDCEKKEIILKALEGLSISTASDLQKVLRVDTYTSQATAFHRLMAELPVFQSRMGAMLFLISALLSRGMESIEADRDDPSLPLVTAPFGHASQETVNLLLCGQAVPNVFDGNMDLEGGLSLKGIPTNVEVGFLTLLESLNFCKVGHCLKSPKWPIWVVGSESHYTVLFALDPAVQEENEVEKRESTIRKAFDAQDQSGGGGFISVEGFHQVLRHTSINFPPEKIDNLCSSGFIVWNEFWQGLLELDKSSGGLKDPSGLMGKEFDVYHFNGIAKSVLTGNAAIPGSEIPLQRPRLCKLSVSVPQRWTREEFLTDVAPASSAGPSGEQDVEVDQPTEPAQHAPLVDCIRTRWPRAICRWAGDAPSIV